VWAESCGDSEADTDAGYRAEGCASPGSEGAGVEVGAEIREIEVCNEPPSEDRFGKSGGILFASAHRIDFAPHRSPGQRSGVPQHSGGAPSPA
jgi:hypothetical protein